MGQYLTYTFTATNTQTAICNFDLGDEIGTFCFDDFLFARTVLLPVEYTDFWAKQLNNNTLELNWSTATEEQLDYFSIQKSNDLRVWENIGTVAAKGEAHHYKAIDKQPFLGENYYRIQSVDVDGSTAFSSTISVYIAEENVPHIYPNPTQNALFIEGKNIQTIQIFSLDGQLQEEVSAVFFEEQIRLDIQDLPKGIYLIQVMGEGVFYSEKLIKH